MVGHRPRKDLRPQKHWAHRHVLKTAFLVEARRRLRNDVQPYFATIKAIHEGSGEAVGFWALARMLFPVVEGVATVIYRSRMRRPGPKQKLPALLLHRLGFKYPNVTWEMFRHTLMHYDEMAVARYGGRKVTWEIRIGGGHVAADGHIAVDAKRLYENLVSFLTAEIKRAAKSRTSVWVRESLRFNTATARSTLDEMLALGRR